MRDIVYSAPLLEASGFGAAARGYVYWLLQLTNLKINLDFVYYSMINPLEYLSVEEIDYFNRAKLKNWADFENIKKFRIQNMADLFWEHFEHLNAFLNEKTDKKNIIMSHFLPSFQSVAEPFRGKTSNFVFATELDFLMHMHQIDFWLHGHTHSSLDYLIGDTRVVCNPRGYKDINSLNSQFEWLKIIDFS